MKIRVLTTVEAGLDVLDILRGRLDLAGVIGLTRRTPGDAVSGYVYMGDYCERHGLAFTAVDRYALDSEDDKRRLLGLETDVLLVTGWQRLVPAWLIAHCREGVIGAHGSAYGITGGRGRSPQNWALMMGRDRFYISIFLIDAGVDSGEIIDEREFPLTSFDDIRSSYHKVSWLVAHMIIESLKTGSFKQGAARPQAGDAAYMPQRRPEDGEIDWRRATREVYDFVRALARPYPGAFSDSIRGRVTVWRARPFDVPSLDASGEPGRVVKRFADGALLVRTGDGFLLVEDYEPAGVEEGTLLKSGDFLQQMRRIVARHKDKCPGLPIAPDVERLAGTG